MKRALQRTVSFESAENNIEELSPLDWDSPEVIAWLRTFKFSKEERKSLVEYVRSSKITGHTLIHKRVYIVRNLSRLFPGFSETSRKKLQFAILLLSKNKFRRRRAFVFNKVTDYLFSENEIDDVSIHDVMVKFFSFYTEVFRYFLIVHSGRQSTVNQRKYQRLKRSIDRKYQKVTGSRFFDAKLECHDFGAKLREFGVKIVGDKLTIPFKIVLCDILDAGQVEQRKMRSFVSPLVNLLPSKKVANFGMFHTGVVIGPWFLDWTVSEIVFPKSFTSSRALISHDIPGHTAYVVLDDIKNLIDVIYRWNTRFEYSLIKTNTSGNCQHFISDVLSVFGVNPGNVFSRKCPHGIGGYLKKLRKSGNCKLEISPSGKFLRVINAKWKTKVFRTHSQLDDFVIRVKSIIPNFLENFPDMHALLKSFDRAFWLRHKKYPQKKEFKPLEVVREIEVGDNMEDEFGFIDNVFSCPSGENVCKCPFTDPRITGSYSVL